MTNGEMAWAAISAEADRMGLPEHFKGDLEVDRQQLVDRIWGDPPRTFFYALRTSGTQLCKTIDEAQGVDKIFNPKQIGGYIYWYRWDGEQLIAYNNLKDAINALADELKSPWLRVK